MAAPRLKASRNRSQYKTTDRFLDAVYRKNKEYIDSHIDPELLTKHSPKTIFKFLVKDQMQYQNQKTGKKYTAIQAIRRVANSKEMNPTFTTSDIFHANFENLLRKDKTVFKEFRNLTRENGRFTAYDYRKLEFEGYYNVGGTNSAVYKYDDFYIIEKKSPDEGTGASVEILESFNFDTRTGKDIFFKGYSAKNLR